LALLCAAAPPAAADAIFWSRYADGGSVRFGNLDGPGNGNVALSQAAPSAIAIDTAAGKIYWANTSGDAIVVANIDGSGARSLFTGEDGVNGLAIDAIARKLYWTNGFADQVRVGNLDGTGAQTLFNQDYPVGLVIDRAGRRIYWTSYNGFTVHVGNLGGGGAKTLVSGENYPTGLAIDPAAGKLYWANEFAGIVRVANLDGSGKRNLHDGEETIGNIAIDPAAGKIYWGEYTYGLIRVANLDGSGDPQSLFTDEPFAWAVALLHAPEPAGAPIVTGGSDIGQPLTCDTGTWGADLLGASLYRAPRSFAHQWLKDGAPIDGAVTSVYTPFAPGAYSCRVTATNHEGSAAQTSADHAVVAPPPPPPSPPLPAAPAVPAQTAPPPPLRQLRVAYNIFYAFDGRRNLPKRFQLSQIPRGATLEVRCKGRGCPFTRKSAKFRGTRANLMAVVRRARLARRAYLEVRTSAPGYVTEVLRFTAAGSTGARVTRLCLPAGARSPRSC
jgi:hypothetical protein